MGVPVLPRGPRGHGPRLPTGLRSPRYWRLLPVSLPVVAPLLGSPLHEPPVPTPRARALLFGRAWADSVCRPRRPWRRAAGHAGVPAGASEAMRTRVLGTWRLPRRPGSAAYSRVITGRRNASHGACGTTPHGGKGEAAGDRPRAAPRGHRADRAGRRASRFPGLWRPLVASSARAAAQPRSHIPPRRADAGSARGSLAALSPRRRRRSLGLWGTSLCHLCVWNKVSRLCFARSSSK